MPIEKVKIMDMEYKEIETKFGPSIKVSLKQELDGGHRFIGVFQKPEYFNENDWKPGTTVDLEVKRNG